jgi:hypothetical protein
MRTAEGDSLEFFDGKRRVATGVVGGVLGADLAAVRLTTGSLRDIKDPRRLRVVARRGSPAPAPTLRVGLPGPHRANLLFACSDVSVAVPGGADTYAEEELSDRSYRLIRSADFPSPARDWPETLLVRLFDEATDEEIALERGELDVAVFWPGELSAHIREQPRWSGFPYGIRSRGLLAAVRAAPGGSAQEPLAPTDFASAPLARLQALNADVFRGDLLPYESAFEAWPGETDSVGGTARRRAVRFDVDRASPGWRLMERELARGGAPEDSGVGLERIHLRYLDARSREPEAVRDSLGVLPLYAIRCPVVCAAAVRPVVRRLGADRLAGMPECLPERRGP